MPSIFKSGQFINSGDSVMLPDIPEPKIPVLPEIEDEGALSPAKLRELMVQRGRQEGEEEAKKIAEEANLAANEIISKAMDDAESIREAARLEALEAKSAELYGLINEVNKAINGTYITLDTFMVRFEKELTSFALSIAEKVIARAIHEDDTLLVDMVKTVVHSVRSEGRVIVEVSEQLPALVAQLKKELSAKQYEGRIEVNGKDLPLDSCILDTPDGIVDASVSEQLKNLRALLENDED